MASSSTAHEKGSPHEAVTVAPADYMLAGKVVQVAVGARRAALQHSGVHGLPSFLPSSLEPLGLIPVRIRGFRLVLRGK